MSLEYKSENPTIDQFRDLFLMTGWNEEYHLTVVELAKALQASWFTISVYQGERLIGFGRVVSDGVLHAMVYDLIVDPEFRCKGVGSEILNRLVKRCQSANIRDIQLFCVRGKRAFYEKRGFVARSEEGPGMQLACTLPGSVKP